MTFDSYQSQSRKSIKYRGFASDLRYIGLGLAGETGEVVEKVKKVYRDKKGKIDQEDKKEIVKEMGDVLWYLARMADILKVSFSEVARIGLDKALSRKERGQVQGSGDNR